MAKSIFDIGLKGLLDTLPKVAKMAYDVFGSMNKDLERTRGNLESLAKPMVLHIEANGIENAHRLIHGLHTSLRSLVNGRHKLHLGWGSIGKIGGGKMGKGMALGGGAEIGLGKAGGGPAMVAMALEKGVEMAYDYAKEGLDETIAKDRQVQRFSAFIDKYSSDRLYNKLLKEASRAGFEIDDIAPGMQRLLAGGLSADDAMHDMHYLLNALNARGHRGDANILEMTGGELSRIAVTGRLDEDAMSNFEKADIPVAKMLSNYLNVSEGQISAWSDDGTLKDHVTYDQFVKALEKAGTATGLFGDALATQSNTLSGRVDMINGKNKEEMTKMFDSPMAREGIEKWEKGKQDLTNAFSGFTSGFGDLVATFGGWIGTGLSYMFGNEHEKMKHPPKPLPPEVKPMPLSEGVRPYDKNFMKDILQDEVNKTKGVFEAMEKKLNPKTSDKKNTGNTKNDPHTRRQMFETGNAIIGGGEKQIVINVKSFAEHFNVYAQNIRDSGREVKEVFETMFLEVLMSANAAM